MEEEFRQARLVLGVSAAEASQRAPLRAAFRREVLRHHPDKNPSEPDAAAARFRAASDSFALLAPLCAEPSGGGGNAGGGAANADDDDDDELARFARDVRAGGPPPDLERLLRLASCF